MTNTARKMKVVTQMGNQGGSSKGVDKIKEWVDKKLIGNINKVYSWINRPVWPQGFKMPNPSSDKPKFELGFMAGSSSHTEIQT